MILKHLFGDDIFISYTRSDAVAYAAALAEHLAARDFSCFLDQYGMPPGEVPPPPIRRALRRSSSFVLIGTEGAIASRAVAMEVEQFLKTKRIFIPIDFGGALERAPWYPTIAGAARTPESAEALKNGEPSPAVLNRIEKTLNFTRRNKRVRYSFIAAALILITLTGVSVYAARAARKQQQATAVATAEAIKQQKLAEENAGKANEQEKIAKVNATKASEQEKIAKTQEAQALKNAEEAKQRLQQYVQEKTNKESLAKSAEAMKDPRKAQSLQNAIEAGKLGKQGSDPTATQYAKTALMTTVDNLLEEFRVHPSLVSADNSGQKIAVISPLGAGVLVNNKTGSRFSLCGHRFPITTVAFNPSGKYLITFSEHDGALMVWDTETGKGVGHATIPGIHVSFSSMFAPDGEQFVTSEFSGPTRVWKLPTAEVVKKLDAWGDLNTVFDPRPENPIVATYGSTISNEFLTLWNRTTGQKIWSYHDKVNFDFVTYAKNGTLLIGLTTVDLGSDKPNYFVVVDIGKDGKPIRDKTVPFDQFDYALLFDPVSRPYSETDLRGTLGDLLGRKHPDPAGPYGFDALWPNHKGSMALTSRNNSDADSLNVFSLSSLDVLGSVERLEKQHVRSAKFSQDDSLLGINSFGSFTVWSASTQRTLWSVRGDFEEFKFSDDGTRVILWRADLNKPKNDVWIYDAKTGGQVAHLEPEAEKMASPGGAVADFLDIVFADKNADHLIIRTEHTAFLWDVPRQRYTKESLFAKDKQLLEQDEKAVSNARSLDDLISLAKRRSNSCVTRK